MIWTHQCSMYGHFNNVVYVQYVDALVNEYLSTSLVLHVPTNDAPQSITRI